MSPVFFKIKKHQNKNDVQVLSVVYYDADEVALETEYFSFIHPGINYPLFNVGIGIQKIKYYYNCEYCFPIVHNECFQIL